MKYGKRFLCGKGNESTYAVCCLTDDYNRPEFNDYEAESFS